MQIPKTMKVGPATYTVKISPGRAARRYGFVSYTEQAIHIHDKRAGKAVPESQMNETFWHELTHAVLYEMGNPLWSDEKFVTEFSKNLSEAIDSARF